MKKLIILFTALLACACSRDWETSPFESDEDLKQRPEIVRIEPNAEYNLVVYLGYSYSDKANIILERKTKGGFERINYIRLSQTALVDTLFDKELDYNFIYRVYVDKNGYHSDYSSEKTYNYVSSILMAPAALQTQTLELQGIKLEWRDRSGKEDGYKIEKNSGGGYWEIASLPANSQSYTDIISGIPSTPLQLSYRINAYNSTFSSQYREISTNYMGIGVPTNLLITDTTSSHFVIEWEDNSNIETGYVVERSQKGSAFVEIGQVAANMNKYVDNIAEKGLYCYRVRAKKDNLYSLYSNEVSFNIKIVIPLEGLIAYYPFNGSANDESGNGINGTVNGPVLSKDRFEFDKNSYRFSAAGDGINLGNNSILNPTKEITISTWIKPLGTRGYQQVIISKHGDYNTSSNSYLLAWSPDSYFTFYISNDGQSLCGRSSTIKVLINSGWHHIVGVFKSNQIQDIYIDGLICNGELVISYSGTNSQPTQVIPSQIATTQTQVNIGRFYTPGSSFIGDIDDLRIYNKALSKAEIHTLCHEGGWEN